MCSPTVSVIIPVYNVEQYITQAVQSVLNQTYPHWELLIIDDGSPDQSVNICQQFEDSRIKIISQANRGLAGARNTGIREAQGEYLAFLDGDDLWTVNKLEKHLEHLESSPQVGVSFSPSALIDQTGTPLHTYLIPRLNNITIPYLLRENPVGNGSAAVVRKVVFEEIATTSDRKAADLRSDRHGNLETVYFDEQFRRAEDIELWLRIAIQTDWAIAGIPEALTLYRVNSNGLSAEFHQHLATWEQVLAKIHSYAPTEIAAWENMSRAYKLRYAARNSIRHQSGKTAVEFMHRALASYPKMLREEPRRTLLTLMVAYWLYFVPQPFYRFVAAWGNKLNGSFQKRLYWRKVNSYISND